MTYCDKIIESGFELDSEYSHLFMADNQNSNEIIFPVTFDGIHTRTWGGMTFVVHAAVGGSMNPADFGIDGGWGGTRVTKELVKKFYPNIDGGMLLSPVPPMKSSYPVLYVPGSYHDPSWDPANSPTVASVNNDGVYDGYIFMPEADMQFKYTDGPGWDVNYGDDGADGTLEANGANLAAPEAGYYRLSVNLNDMTHSYTKTEWGIIGSATAGGWDSDQDMTFDAETGVWTAILDMVPGEFKFRANDDWAINIGDNGPDGALEYDGANIVVDERGTYTITMTLGSPDYTYTVARGSFDGRAMFYTDGQTLEIEDPFEFTHGYAVTKFKNLNSDGSAPSDLTFIDTDFPLFRLADFYLMYAEAAIQTGNNTAKALDYVNLVRTRAYGEESGNITSSDLTIDWIIDERARELFWEGHRRTDLIRFGKLSGGEYLWPWKGGVAEGTAIDSKFDLFPIPSSDMGANPNLTQNTGY
ncbi:MAG: RagB/SusD family nutrient uptake outer membrane protein [Bacteroidota bacterium]|nr:RagB/SusD family nutrient uptake outer membrane protein [Bacteroidota bacterium]